MSGSWRAGSMFLLFKQKTAYEMRISDWSSDVCSSDLGTLAYWSQPSPENEAAATAHLTFEGTRDQYLADVPPDVAARIPAESWEEDWRVRAEERRVGKGAGSTGRSRWSPYPSE